MCDTLCMRQGDGTWFAKNSDRPPDEPQVVEAYPARPATGRTRRMQYIDIPDAPAAAFVGSRPTWLTGLEHGVNEHGVAVGNERIWTTTRARDLPPALLGMDIVRLVLERARDADEALAVCTGLVEQFGQGGSGDRDHDDPYCSSFLIADSDSGWIVETDGRSWAARPTGAGAAISNRVSLGRDWTVASADVAPGSDFDVRRNPRMPTAVADGRLAVTRARVAAGAGSGPATLAETLRDHGPGHPTLPRGDGIGDFTVCLHRPDARSQTTASMIAHLRPDRSARMWACLGNPCLGVFVPVFFGAAPGELSDERQWLRFAALRDAVGTDEDRAAEVRLAFSAVESELWAEADGAEAGDSAAIDTYARTAFARVDAALRSFGV